MTDLNKNCSKCRKSLIITTNINNPYPEKPYYEITEVKGKSEILNCCEDCWKTEESKYLGNLQFNICRHKKEEKPDGKIISKFESVQFWPEKKPFLKSGQYQCHVCQKVGKIKDLKDKFTCQKCGEKHLEVNIDSEDLRLSQIESKSKLKEHLSNVGIVILSIIFFLLFWGWIRKKIS